MSQNQSQNDLFHFLNLAAAQIRHHLKEAESKEAYAPHINQLRMLEELIREQLPMTKPNGGSNNRFTNRNENEAR